MTTITVAIRGVQTKKFISLDGRKVTKFESNGSGFVGVTDWADAWETFKLRYVSAGVFTLESSVFPNAFLRLDGSGVQAGKLYGPGAGTVNAQFGAGEWERFRLVKKNVSGPQKRGIVAIESAAFTGRFLRAADKVNVQGVFNVNEEFEILIVG